ncbi:MAG: hypothetical protein ACI9H8_000093 [Lysobacterales bacterium]|jgi:hypothetical protein
MKKLMLIPLPVLLSACVSYYYPAPETAYIVETVATPAPVEEVAYIGESTVVSVPAEETYYTEQYPEYTDYSASYAGADYYPWWSMDYFYLGSRHSHNGFSLGINYNYGYQSRWYDPYWHIYPLSYAYYSPFSYSLWYSPYNDYGYNRYGWNDYYWRHKYNRHHQSNHGNHDRYSQGNRHNDSGRNQDGNRGYGNNSGTADFNRDHGSARDEGRFASSDPDRGRNRRNGEDGRIPANAASPGPGTPGRGSRATVAQQVSNAPGGRNSTRGMEIRSREGNKPGKTRMEPKKPEVRLSPSTRVAASPVASRRSNTTGSRTSAGEIRSYTAGKERGTSRSPVVSQPSSGVTTGSVSGSSGPSRIVSSRSSNSTIRSRADTKNRSSNTQPIRMPSTRPQVVQTPSRQSSVQRPSPQVQRNAPRAAPVRQAQRPSPQVQRSAPRAAPVRQAQRPPQQARQNAPRPAAAKGSSNRGRSSSSAKPSARVTERSNSEKRR